MQNSYLQGVRFSAYPTSELANTLSQWIGCSRVIYNCKVHDDREAFKAGTPRKVDQTYSQFKTEDRSWLKETPSQVLRNSASRYFEAYQRFFKGLAHRPNFKKKGQRDSVWLTKELFRFVDGKLILGTEKHPIGELAFHAHRPYQEPASLVISRRHGRWYVSFSYEQETEEPIRTKDELVYELQGLSAEELEQVAWAGDRGVVIPIAGSDALNFEFSAIQQERLNKVARQRKRYQRRLARQVKGSNRRNRTKHQIARTHRYEANVREDFAHQTSYKLANSSYRLFIGEALKVKNMTRRPKAKQNANGKWLRNGASAKAGLNRGILSSAWGLTMRCLDYKAQRRGKLYIEVPPHYTSQECSACGYTHPDNRPKQAIFVCQKCGHRENADTNAGKVTKKRGVRMLLAGEIRFKEKKRISVRMQQIGVELPELTRWGDAVRPVVATAAQAASLNREEAPSITA